MLLALVMSISGVVVEGLTRERANIHGLLAASAEHPTAQPTTVLGIRLADSYRSTRRSLHYIPLFLGLVFLTYFLFEIRTGKRVHPAQYALVGVAQTVFYLLLLSFAEHLGFDISFLIAGASTVALLSVNTEWVFRSRTLALRALGGLYDSLYLHLCAVACGGVRSPRWRDCELRSGRCRDVHHAQCRLVWAGCVGGWLRYGSFHESF